MDGGVLLGVGIAALVVLVVVFAVVMVMRTKRRRSHLQDWFGPEYDRTVDHHERRRDAERDLQDRVERREQVRLRPLSSTARERYEAEWQRVQERFVDRPRSSVDDAAELVTQLLRDRGYPVDDFDERAELVSVDHPHVVDRYRAAHAIRERGEHGNVSTEDLREAMVHYRSLFEEALTDASADGSSHTDRRAG